MSPTFDIRLSNCALSCFVLLLDLRICLMPSKFEDTFKGSLGADGSILAVFTPSSIDQRAYTNDDAIIEVVRPPVLANLLKQIESGAVVASADEKKRLLGARGSSYYGSQVSAIQSFTKHGVPLPHGIDGNWSTQCNIVCSIG